MLMAAKYDESVEVTNFRAGDTVRCLYNDESCVVIWTWNDWLWLNPLDFIDAAPFTGRAADYTLVGRGLL